MCKQASVELKRRWQLRWDWVPYILHVIHPLGTQYSIQHRWTEYIIIIVVVVIVMVIIIVISISISVVLDKSYFKIQCC